MRSLIFRWSGPRLLRCCCLSCFETRHQPERGQPSSLARQASIRDHFHRDGFDYYDRASRWSCIGRSSPIPWTLRYTKLTARHLFLPACPSSQIGVAESRRANQNDSPITSEQANNILLAGLAAQVSHL